MDARQCVVTGVGCFLFGNGGHATWVLQRAPCNYVRAWCDISTLYTLPAAYGFGKGYHRQRHNVLTAARREDLRGENPCYRLPHRTHHLEPPCNIWAERSEQPFLHKSNELLIRAAQARCAPEMRSKTLTSWASCAFKIFKESGQNMYNLCG